GIDVRTWTVFREAEPPGIPWAAVATNGSLRFTIGEGPDDDRYIRRFVPNFGFPEKDRIACPEFTGSYLSYDGDHLYLSQWYKHRILKLDAGGKVIREIDVGAEVSGHVFIDDLIYVLRGTEQDGERWRIAPLDSRPKPPAPTNTSDVRFACRWLTFDGEDCWTNPGPPNEIAACPLPN